MNLISNQILLKFYSRFFAKKEGIDDYGNIYYSKKNKSAINNYRERRWVIYNGEIEASKVPQQWNAWLHHVISSIPSNRTKKEKWMKKHLPNKKRNVNLQKAKKFAKKNYDSWDPNNV